MDALFSIVHTLNGLHPSYSWTLSKQGSALNISVVQEFSYFQSSRHYTSHQNGRLFVNNTKLPRKNSKEQGPKEHTNTINSQTRHVLTRKAARSAERSHNYFTAGLHFKHHLPFYNTDIHTEDLPCSQSWCIYKPFGQPAEILSRHGYPYPDLSRGTPPNRQRSRRCRDINCA